ncbi:MAG: hypothetical protein V1897_11750, partial [Pseudomonadota bacterium]
MRKNIRVVLSGAFVLSLLLAPWLSQRTQAQGYDQYASSLMQSGDQGQNSQMPQAYYPYWHNYLDNLQREGGYYSVTGNYGNSAPVTSYYPSNPSSEAMSPQVTSQSGMYYNPQDYYGASQQQAYQQPNQAAYQTYQNPTQYTQPQPAQTKRSSKRQKQPAASQPVQQPSYATQQQPAYYPPQQQGYGQQAYGQQGYSQYQQPAAGPQDAAPAYSADPSVQAAQQKAYERAIARQRAAELAAQQAAATSELQQTQQLYMAAQQKLKEQEQKQKELQNEYHKKAVGEAYENLRESQRRYYDLMGVAAENARQSQVSPQAALGPQQPMPQQQQYQPQMASPAQPSYPQGVPAANYATPGVNTGASQMAPSAYPPGQSTPIQIQPQQQAQQESSGGLWSTLKEIFSPPTTAPVPN